MKRLWIRAHALGTVHHLATLYGTKDVAERLDQTMRQTTDPNRMVVVDIDDDLAAAVQRDGFFRASGKVLEEGEEPPYLGNDPPLSEEELRTEFARP